MVTAHTEREDAAGGLDHERDRTPDVRTGRTDWCYPLLAAELMLKAGPAHRTRVDPGTPRCARCRSLKMLWPVPGPGGSSPAPAKRHNVVVVALTWTEVARRMADAKNYWIHTTGASGAPNATPVWGVIVDGSFYLYSERSTVKSRNLERDPRVVIHLESGSDVVIVHGRLVDQGRPADHRVVVEAFDHKYDSPAEKPFLPSSDPAFDVLYCLQPRRALMWSLPDTEASTRRWRSRQPDDPSAQ